MCILKGGCVFVCVWICIDTYYTCKSAETLKKMGAKSEFVCTWKCVYSRVSVCLCVYEYVHSTYAHLLRRSRKWVLRASVCLYVYEYIYTHITHANGLNCSRKWAPRVSVYVLVNVYIQEWVCVCVCMNICIARMHICWDAQGNWRQEWVCVYV